MFSVIHVSQQTYFGASLAFGDLSVLNRQHWKSLFVLLPFSHFIRRYEQKTAATIHTTDKNPIQSESKLQLDLQKIMLENLCYEIHRKKEKKQSSSVCSSLESGVDCDCDVSSSSIQFSWQHQAWWLEMIIGDNRKKIVSYEYFYLL